MQIRCVRAILIGSVVLFTSNAILAQTAPASSMAASTTAPALQPPVASTQGADPSTPRGALKALIDAQQDGDADKIKSLIATTNPTEGKMVDAMAMMCVSQKKFRDAAKSAFGDGAKELVGDDLDAKMVAAKARVDAAPETINGDDATVDRDERPNMPPYKLKKMDGQWRIPIREFAQDIDQKEIQQRLDELNFVSKMMDESAGELLKGVYKTPKDAGEAIKSKLLVAMMKRANAAKQATSQPDAPPPVDAPATAPSTPGL